MIALLWIRGVLTRRYFRVVGAAAGIAVTVALFAAMSFFLLNAGNSMTARAVSAVPIDWQVQVISGANPSEVGTVLAQTGQVQAMRLVSYADVAGLEAQSANTTQTTGPGQVIAFDPGYAADFSAEVRPLSGGVAGVLIAQQTAANLHVGPGDRVSIKRIGLPPIDVKVDGVIDLPDADSLFQAVGLPAQAAPQAPPDNVIVLPRELWNSIFDPQRQARPDTIRLQWHVRFARELLPPQPVAAYTYVTSAQHHLEAQLVGRALVADNLGSRLAAVREDALYASVVFLFLGLPGLALATALTLAIAGSGAERRRTEQALLRIRGATIPQILTLCGLEAIVASACGTAMGLAGAWIFGHINSSLAFTWGGSRLLIATLCLFGAALGFSAFMIPALRDARSATVIAARRSVARSGNPLWRRVGLDMLLLAGAGFFFWQSASTGYQIVLAPEGVAATSVDYKAFIAPAMFWVGIALLSLRVTSGFVASNSGVLRAAIAPVAGRLAPVVAAALSRQSSRLTLAIAMTALAVSFATSTAVFNSTYKAQARIDAELTNGSDVTVFGTVDRPAGVHARALASLPGAAAVEPMQHRFAYVGADLQDLYGIDPNRIQQATRFSDAFFSGDSAARTLARLALTPDGILVSEETVQDFQLQLGDAINLRLLNASDNKYHVVGFKFIGVVREFPTAPKDSFLVANSAYVAQMTGFDQSEYLLMRASGSPRALHRDVTTVLAMDPSLKISDIGEATHLIGSSLTAVDLGGLTAIELSFSVLLAAASAGLMLALGFAERRRPFAILGAIGAKPHQLAAFFWSEGLLMIVGGLVLGLLSGLLTAWMLVKLLTGVFDPPPETLTIPWTYLGLLVSLVIVSVVGAVMMTRSTTSFAAEQLRDL